MVCALNGIGMHCLCLWVNSNKKYETNGHFAFDPVITEMMKSANGKLMTQMFCSFYKETKEVTSDTDACTAPPVTEENTPTYATDRRGNSGIGSLIQEGYTEEEAVLIASLEEHSTEMDAEDAGMAFMLQAISKRKHEGKIQYLVQWSNGELEFTHKHRQCMPIPFKAHT
ncbi:uncharacterized protein LOC135498394 [Lineus longissimus]|uniref:uncharacterized protein LOC135498394 n=1 Tax=Lineus longissimus TaxID=88925 RepID=UPI00315CF1DB